MKLRIQFLHLMLVMLRYALHIPLRDNLNLSAGTALHLINYSFHASGQGASGSDINGSGSIGTTLYSSTFKVGISLNDFNNPAIRPVNFRFQVSRFAMIYAEKIFDLSENTKVRASVRYNKKKDSPSTSILLGGLVFSDLVSVSGFVYVHRGWGFAFDLNRIKVYKNYLKMSLAYQVPGPDVYPAVSKYELNLAYYIHHE